MLPRERVTQYLDILGKTYMTQTLAFFISTVSSAIFNYFGMKNVVFAEKARLK